MKIPRLELKAVKLPLRPFTTAAGTLESREGFLVFTDDGGVGEAMPLPSAGTECTRAHHRAEKKAPKNITSEKMNQVMLQR